MRSNIFNSEENKENEENKTSFPRLDNKKAFVDFGPEFAQLKKNVAQTSLQNEEFHNEIKFEVENGSSEIKAYIDYIEENFEPVRTQVTALRYKFEPLSSEHSLTQECSSHLRSICLSLIEAKNYPEKYDLFCLNFLSKEFDQCDSGARDNLRHLAKELSHGFNSNLINILDENIKTLAIDFLKKNNISRGIGHEIHDVSTLMYYASKRLGLSVSEEFFEHDEHRYLLEDIIIRSKNALELWHEWVDEKITPNLFLPSLTKDPFLEDLITSHQPVISILEDSDQIPNPILNKEQLLIFLTDKSNSLSLHYRNAKYDSEHNSEHKDINLKNYELVKENFNVQSSTCLKDPMITFHLSQILHQYYIYPGSDLSSLRKKIIQNYYFNEQDEPFLEYLLRAPVYGVSSQNEVLEVLFIKLLANKQLVLIDHNLKEKLEALETFHHKSTFSDWHREVFYYFSLFPHYLMAIENSNKTIEDELKYLEDTQFHKKIPEFYKKIKDFKFEYEFNLKVKEKLNIFIESLFNCQDINSRVEHPPIEKGELLITQINIFLNQISKYEREFGFEQMVSMNEDLQSFFVQLIKEYFKLDKPDYSLFKDQHKNSFYFRMLLPLYCDYAITSFIRQEGLKNKFVESNPINHIKDFINQYLPMKYNFSDEHNSTENNLDKKKIEDILHNRYLRKIILDTPMSDNNVKFQAELFTSCAQLLIFTDYKDDELYGFLFEKARLFIICNQSRYSLGVRLLDLLFQKANHYSLPQIAEFQKIKFQKEFFYKFLESYLMQYDKTLRSIGQYKKTHFDELKYLADRKDKSRIENNLIKLIKTQGEFFIMYLGENYKDVQKLRLWNTDLRGYIASLFIHDFIGTSSSREAGEDRAILCLNLIISGGYPIHQLVEIFSKLNVHINFNIDLAQTIRLLLEKLSSCNTSTDEKENYIQSKDFELLFQFILHKNGYISHDLHTLYHFKGITPTLKNKVIGKIDYLTDEWFKTLEKDYSPQEFLDKVKNKSLEFLTWQNLDIFMDIALEKNNLDLVFRKLSELLNSLKSRGLKEQKKFINSTFSKLIKHLNSNTNYSPQELKKYIEISGNFNHSLLRMHKASREYFLKLADRCLSSEKILIPQFLWEYLFLENKTSVLSFQEIDEKLEAFSHQNLSKFSIQNMVLEKIKSQVIENYFKTIRHFLSEDLNKELIQSILVKIAKNPNSLEKPSLFFKSEQVLIAVLKYSDVQTLRVLWGEFDNSLLRLKGFSILRKISFTHNIPHEKINFRTFINFNEFVYPDSDKEEFLSSKGFDCKYKPKDTAFEKYDCLENSTEHLLECKDSQNSSCLKSDLSCQDNQKLTREGLSFSQPIDGRLRSSSYESSDFHTSSTLSRS